MAGYPTILRPVGPVPLMLLLVTDRRLPPVGTQAMPFLLLTLVPGGVGRAKTIHIWPGDTEEKLIYIWPGNMFGSVITIIRPFAPLLLMSLLVTCRLLYRLLHGRASSLSRLMKTSAAGQSRSAVYLAGASLRHHATLQFPNR